MSKKYKLVPIFDENKTLGVNSATIVEGGLSILSKKLKEIEKETGEPQDMNGSMVIMISKLNGESISMDEIKQLEDLFDKKAIIISGISDLSGYMLEEVDEEEE